MGNDPEYVKVTIIVEDSNAVRTTVFAKARQPDWDLEYDEGDFEVGSSYKTIRRQKVPKIVFKLQPVADEATGQYALMTTKDKD